MTCENRMVLITGASRGIGKVVALRLAEAGADCMLIGRNEEALRQTAAEIKTLGRKAEFLSADLSDPEAPEKIIAETARLFGGIDILINNAGIVLAKPLEETTLEEWDRIMAVNARAPFLLCKAAIPHLRKSGGGGAKHSAKVRPAIVNISSVVGRKGYTDQGAYAASKHALLGFTKVLTKELQADGIRVHAVSPGGVATEMAPRVRPDLDESVLIAPEELAEIILFLVTHQGNAVIDEINIRRAAGTAWA